MFATLDPDAWKRAGHNPVRLLGEIPTKRFEVLAKDADPVVTVRELADDLAAYLDGPLWYQHERVDDDTLPAAIDYFSTEFGVSEVLPNYFGGLGVLAGDHLKAASDLGVPLIGVGLLYRSGCFRQSALPRRLAARALPRALSAGCCRCSSSPLPTGDESHGYSGPRVPLAP